MSFASPRFSNDDNVLSTLNVFPLEQRSNKPLIDGRLGGKVEALDCLDDWKTRLPDLALSNTAPQIVPDDDARRIERKVRSALALRPRGAIPNDMLVLNSLRLSGHCLQLEWREREIHPWDRDLPPSRQAELFGEQASQDTDAALIRLFQRLPEIEQIEFQVLKPMAFGGVILTGVVDRERALDPEPRPSLRMRLNMLGVRHKMAENHLVLLPANSWAPMLKKKGTHASINSRFLVLV